MRFVFSVFALVFTGLQAFATGPSFSYEGRAFDSSGNPLNTNVTFKLTVRPPGATFANCAMYSEVQTQNLANSNGFFTLAINNSASTSQTYGGGLGSLNQVFGNSGATVSLTAADCGGSAQSYTSNSGDSRNLVVSISTDGGTTYEDLPAIAMGSVPYAIEAQQLSGLATSQLVRGGSGVNGLVLTGSDMTDLGDLIAGASQKYAKASTAGGTTIVSASSPPASLSNGSLWYDTTNNQLKVYISGSSVALSTGGSALTGLTGDISATGPGTVSATVNYVGGQTAGAINLATTVANSATNMNTATTIVKRDGAGAFSAGAITSTSLYTPSIYGGTAASGNLAIDSTSNASKGTISLGSQTTIAAASPSTASKVLTLTAASTGASGMSLNYTGSGGREWAFYSSGVSGPSAAGSFGLYDLTGAALRMTVDSSGNVGMGTSAPTGNLDVQSSNTNTTINVQNNSNSGSNKPTLSVVNFAGSAATSSYPRVTMINSRGSVGVGSAVQANDVLSSLESYGQYNTASNGIATAIQTVSEGAWSPTPTTWLASLNFLTGPSGAPAARMTITSAGNVGIGITNPVNAGVVTLDIGGVARLKTYTTVPFSCVAAYEGSISFNGSASIHKPCICVNANGGGTYYWKLMDGTSTCGSW